MDDNIKLIESLFKSATEYGKTTFELAKLKIADKIVDVVSSFIPKILVLLLVLTFLFFANIGLAMWLGDVLGEPFLGFLVVAGFYALMAFVFHFLLHKNLKSMIAGFILKHVINI